MFPKCAILYRCPFGYSSWATIALHSLSFHLPTYLPVLLALFFSFFFLSLLFPSLLLWICECNLMPCITWYLPKYQSLLQPSTPPYFVLIPTPFVWLPTHPSSHISTINHISLLPPSLSPSQETYTKPPLCILLPILFFLSGPLCLSTYPSIHLNSSLRRSHQLLQYSLMRPTFLSSLSLCMLSVPSTPSSALTRSLTPFSTFFLSVCCRLCS